MKTNSILLMILVTLSGCQTSIQTNKSEEAVTFCNPVNLSYRFTLDKPSRREAADPTIVWYKDRYFLFASKSGGYWHSSDLIDWLFIATDQIPVEEYAPTAVVLNDTIFFMGSSTEKSTIYKSTDPLSGNWQVAVDELEIPVWDPAFLLDDDNRLYLYWGCSNERPLYGVEVDYRNKFAFIGEPLELVHANPGEYGWEVPGDYNTLVNQSPWIEGAWMTKRNGRYYLQYSGPGTEYKSYADGVYVSENPLGPFDLQAHNPVIYKPEGYAAGAGHGSSLTDAYENSWHIGTITISQKHMFERRLGLYPVFYDEDGIMYSVTKFGDYPMFIPQEKASGFEDIFTGWMLLSYGKNVSVSSSVDSLPAYNMTDEDIRTYWAAETGSADEYALLDMDSAHDVYAIQMNFAEHNTDIYGREKNLSHKYTIDYSNDGTNWTQLADKSDNETDNTHDYIQLENSVSCRFIRVNNIEVPGGHFAISGFRVFGKGRGEKPAKVDVMEAMRIPENRRSVDLKWETSEGATGYNISYGANKNKLYLNYMIYGDTTVTINSLNANQPYWFSIESFNENGVTESGLSILAE
jgi:xylan 1,4-beta-xylosidase